MDVCQPISRVFVASAVGDAVGTTLEFKFPRCLRPKNPHGGGGAFWIERWLMDGR